MLSLVGGELYQWDTGRIVKVVPNEDVTVHEVHFSTKRMDYAYVLKTYTEDGVTYCAIPNIILQQTSRLLCYEVCKNSAGEETIAEATFNITKRNRPEDYVYTEQEHFTVVALESRLAKVEESIPTKTSQLNNDSGYLTEHQSLADYAKKNEIPDAVIPDWEQNNSEGKGFIKNRPFYTEEPPVIINLGNTFDVWDTIWRESSVNEVPLSFVIEGGLYRNVVPKYFSSAYVYNYNAGEYEVTVYKQNSAIKCFAAGKEITNWQIVSVSDKEKIHYLDPKYIEDMYYTEKGPIVTNLGDTYSDWLKLVDGETTDMDKKVLSFLYDGKVYENVKPTYASFASVVIYTFGSSSSDTVVIQYTTKTISAFKPFSFVKIISKDDVVHKIPEKYYDSGALFVITVTEFDENGDCKIDRSWEEIVEELSRNDIPQHYIIRNKYLPCDITIVKLIMQPGTDEPSKIIFGGAFSRLGGDLIASIDWWLPALAITSTKAEYHMNYVQVPLRGFLIKITGNGTASSPYTSDKTYDDISTAYTRDIPIYAILDNIKGQFLLTSLTETGAYFHGPANTSSIYRIVIKNTNEVVAYVNDLEQVSHRVSEITEENSQTVANYPNVAAVKSYVDGSIKSIPVDGTTIKLNDQGQLTLALSNANGVNF